MVEPYPSEKYDFVSWDDDIPSINGKKKHMFQTTNQGIDGFSYGFPMKSPFSNWYQHDGLCKLRPPDFQIWDNSGWQASAENHRKLLGGAITILKNDGVRQWEG